MNESKQAVARVRVLVLLLLGYSVLITVRAISLQERLNRLETSHQDLLANYRVLSNTLRHVEMTPELLHSLQAAMAQERPAQPASTDREFLRMIGAEINRSSRGSSSK
jgi:hypothetical protein